MSGTATDCEPARLADHAWTRSGRNWTAGFWIFLTVAGIRLLTVGGLSSAARTGALLCVATLALAFITLRPDQYRSNSDRTDTAYLAIAAITVGLLCSVESSLSLLLCIVLPQAGMYAPSVRAAGWLTGLIGLSATLGLMTEGGWTTENAGNVLPVMILSTGFTLVFSRWVTRIIEQSAERSELIGQLEATRAKLGEAHHLQGVQAERERVAREIHDTLAQGYTSIIMLAQVARTALEKGRTGDLAQRLDLIEEVARENLGEARSLVAASAPVGLDGATLTDAVRRLVGRFGAETGIATQVSVTGEPAGLSRDGEVVLLRSAQEALANVRRHSGAHSVTVGLTGTEPDARLEVTDDGTGFDVQDGSGPRGFGLAGMRDRAEACGGTFGLASSPGHGTRVTIWIPREKVVR